MSSDSDNEVEVPVKEWTWESFKEKGNEEFKAGRYENAAKYYSDAIEKHDKEPALFSNRAVAFLKTKQYKKALEDANKAIALDKHYLKAYGRGAQAACNLGDFAEGVRLYNTGTVMACGTPSEKEFKEGERNAAAAMRTIVNAKEMISRRDFSGALRALGPSQDQFPDCFTLAVLRSHARATSNPNGAIAELNPFAGTHGDNTDFLYVRALATYHGSNNGTKNAQLILRQALELDPEDERCKALFRRVRALERLREEGNTAFKEKKWAEAIAKYTAAIDEDTSNRFLMGLMTGNRAAAKMELKDYEGALRDCNTAISNNNDAPKIYARRARINEKLEKWDDAIRDLETASEADDNFAGELREMKIHAKQAKRKNYYKILGVERNADERALKKAYKVQALQYHPDKWAHCNEEEKKNAEIKFKDVQEAMSVLSDPKKRRMYDNGQLDNDVEGSAGGPGGGGMPADMDMMNMFSMFMGGGGMGGMGGDPFGGMGGGMGGGGMPRGRRSRGGGMPGGMHFSFQ